jgi:pimeloyl-ACP methyl ester carboxylesterase
MPSMTSSSPKTGTIDYPQGTLSYIFHPPTSSAASSHSKPPLIFIHSGVSDQLLWDGEVAYFTHRGYPCLTYDLPGFGLTTIKPSILEKWKANQGQGIDIISQEGILDHLECLDLLITHLSTLVSTDIKPVLVGLSMGAGIALEYIIAHSSSTSGLIMIAGGIRGADFSPSGPEEVETFTLNGKFTTEKDAEGLAQLMVKLWADGPRTPGRFRGNRDKMMEWNRDICKREVEGTGGSGVPWKQSNGVFPPMEHLSEVKVPTLVAWGEEDVRCISETMKKIVEQVKGVEGRGWERCAHMVNLEEGEVFDAWVGEWLARKFVR